MRSFILLTVGFISAVTFGGHVYAELKDSQPVVYFLVDASGSMKDEIPDAVRILNARSALLDARSQKSITFFGGKPDELDRAVRCDDPVEVQGPFPSTETTPQFPALGGSDDKTSIGQGLAAVLELAGPNGIVVLITDGSEECNSDFLAIRREYPKARIEVYQVGANPNAALRLLEVRPESEAITQAVLADQLPLPVSILPGDPNPEANWVARLSWILILTLAAGAATLFCLQSGERSKDLRDQLVTLDEKTPSDLAIIYTSHENVGGKLKRIPDNKRFKIFWLKNRNEKWLSCYGFWGAFVSVFAAVGLLFLAFPEVGEAAGAGAFAKDVRTDCWSFLNSNIGAVSFAGTVLALAGFSAFQWWQTFEAKKELLINSGTIKNERREAARRKYETIRANILSEQFSLPKLRTSWSPWIGDIEIEIAEFDVLQRTLRNLAAPPFEEASLKKQKNIDRFLKIRDVVTFAKLLSEVGDLDQLQAKSVERMVELAKKDEQVEADKIALELVAGLTNDPQSAENG
ncbi:vWA domain-containing protein [Hyphomonas sp.]|uniref:vWA domain-containing protein n=1 Tax=Hyphomonas sp. TaxID=87 RepID=UPI0025C44E41|nr:vWA domain-containing protein [Hyphomonas sp.]|tara:strand:+ start:786 stop:2342 length:1557 start_codon:yes stop_codon:yes gene_type:complete